MTDEIFNKAKLCFGRDVPSDLTKDNAIEKLIALKTPAKAEISDAEFEQLKLAFGREVPSDLTKQNAIIKLTNHAKTLVKPAEKGKIIDAGTMHLAGKAWSNLRMTLIKEGDQTVAMLDELEKPFIGDTKVDALKLSRTPIDGDEKTFDGLLKLIDLGEKLKGCGAGLRLAKVNVAEDNLSDEKPLTDDQKKKLLAMAGY